MRSDECAGCGGGLVDAPVTGVQRRQVTRSADPPPPKVTVIWSAGAAVRAVRDRQRPASHAAHVTGRAQFGPGTLRWRRTCWWSPHPVHQSTVLLMQMAGVNASTGWMASVRGKASQACWRQAVSWPGSGSFCGRLRRYATGPRPAAGRLAYVHVACTRYLTSCTQAAGLAMTSTPGVPDTPGLSSATDRRILHLTDAARLVRGSSAARTEETWGNSNPPAAVGGGMAALLCEANP